MREEANMRTSLNMVEASVQRLNSYCANGDTAYRTILSFLFPCKYAPEGNAFCNVNWYMGIIF